MHARVRFIKRFVLFVCEKGRAFPEIRQVSNVFAPGETGSVAKHGGVPHKGWQDIFQYKAYLVGGFTLHQ